jgi:ribosome-binding protein aMBF1 (putative translation factor)
MGNHAVAIHNHPEVSFVKPLVLSFSVSRYLNSTFGQYIRKVRLEKGLKQVDVATTIGVDEMTMVN